MADTSSILLLALLAQGESGVLGFANWGEAANSNFEFLEDAVGEVSSVTLAGTDVTLTAAQERSLLIKLSGTLSANVNVNTNDRKGFWFVKNGASGSFTVTFKTTSGSGVVVPQGATMVLCSDGTDVLQISGTEFSDAVFALTDNADTTKKLKFQLSGITSGQTRTITVPDQDVTITAAAAGVLDDASVSAMRTSLELGTAALKNTGTSGNVVPLLDGINNWSANQTIKRSGAFATLNVGSDLTTGSTAVLDFIGHNSAAAQINYARLLATIDDGTNGSEDGRLRFWTMSGGSFTEGMSLTGTALTVVGSIAAASLSLTTDLAVADGGTGTSTAAGAMNTFGATRTLTGGDGINTIGTLGADRTISVSSDVWRDGNTPSGTQITNLLTGGTGISVSSGTIAVTSDVWRDGDEPTAKQLCDIIASRGVGHVGTYAMLKRSNTATNPGNEVDASELAYANVDGDTTATAIAGTWLCCGMTDGTSGTGAVTLWKRLS